VLPDSSSSSPAHAAAQQPRHPWPVPPARPAANVRAGREPQRPQCDHHGSHQWRIAVTSFHIEIDVSGRSKRQPSRPRPVAPAPPSPARQARRHVHNGRRRRSQPGRRSLVHRAADGNAGQRAADRRPDPQGLVLYYKVSLLAPSTPRWTLVLWAAALGLSSSLPVASDRGRLNAGLQTS